jgi:glycosyltransferase involved in cell wall biosynthesis
MKIALLHYSSPPIVGGVESVLAHHARLMANAGHEVTILAGRGKSFDANIPVRILPLLDSRQSEVMDIKSALDRGKYLPSFDALREEIKAELLSELQGFDVLMAHNVASLHKNLPLTAALHDAYKISGFPKLVLWHHDLACTASRYRQEMHDGYPWNLICTNWSGVTQVVVSELRRQELSDLLGLLPESIHVIPNGVDVNAFYKLEPQTTQLIEQLCLLDADPLFLLPVRLTPRKNIELALRILIELRNQFPKSTLLVTGPEGPHNPANAAYRLSLLALRNKLKLQGAVHFLADVTDAVIPDAVIADFYRLADALLFPSLEEGFGIPLIEAAFSSIPVFCSDIPVLRELCGEDVSYFDPDSEPNSIANMIIERLQSEASSRWARRAKHSFSWNSIYTYLIEPLIQEVGK